MTNATENKIVTPEQRRAKAAWKVAQTLKDEKACDDFFKLCKKTASRILNSGLMPALAFLTSKKDDGQNASVLNAFKDQLSSNGLFVFVIGNQNTLLDRLVQNADGTMLRRAQSEALSYLEWLARFAEGRAIELKPKEGGVE
ncbi:MAG: type III-B CRISPR module-associated protein Cmr5 [Candidatus Omnitrophica bacterium]|nr:type III-B CRISPR module-associated protein Cmr5 [Candidatus Omnitrophota bacterium]MBU4478019.1 type III-B CRISPR module-associated protein Cmr5 [Candidatus Omnitrophota bacterium]